MNLKRLEMIGFKSFADKTVIEFQDGITGIVGPNGSGKSNISDAIRWVLGEQSAKQLRGGNMQDVIFKGTQERQPLNYCEVTLVFDNTSHIFSTDYEEIAVTRKLYRSGESEYYINKTKTRLADIKELLHEVGIGKDSYFIIGQNKVANIVQSKPAERRKIFEEAAGIAQFKESRRESQNKLIKTQDNLKICQNVLAEIETRLEPLKRQSVATRKFLDLKEKLKIYEINNYIYQYENANDMKNQIRIKIDAITEELDDKNKTLKDVVKKSGENSRAIEKIDENVARLYNKKTDLMVAKEKNSGETKLLKEKQRALIEDVDRLSAEINVSQNTLNQSGEELERINADIEKLKQHTQNLNSEITTVTSEYSQILDKLTQSEFGSANSQKDMINALNQLSDAKEDLAKLTSEQNSLLEINEKDKADLEDVNERYAQSQALKLRLEKSLESLNKEKQTLLKDYSDVTELINKSEQRSKELEVLINSNIKELSSTESRYRVLSDLEKDFNGYNNGVTSILKASKVNNEIKKHLIGVVANMINVPKEYRTAIETALGNNVQNVIVENVEDAEALIKFLKVNKYGQATFLPLSSAKPKYLNPKDIKSYDMQGCIGVASDLITYDPKIESVVKTLLGKIVICSDIHSAAILAKNNGYSFRTVTLDGDQTFTNGALSGGSQRSNSSHILNREKDIEELKKQCEILKNKDIQMQKERLEIMDNAGTFNTNLKKLREEISANEITLAKTEEMYSSTCKTNDEQKIQFEILTNKVSLSNKKLVELSSQINILKIQEQNLSNNRNLATESMEFTQKQANELKIEKDKYQEKISNIRLLIAENNTRLSANEDNVLRLNNTIVFTKNNIESLTAAKEEKNIERQEIETQIAMLQNTKQYVEIEDELQKVEGRLQYYEEYKKSIQEESKKLEDDRMYLSSSISSLTEKRNQEDINMAKVDMDLENMEQRVWEGYELTYGTCQEYRQQDYDVAKGIVNAQNCRRDMERLGNVNLNAIEELEEQQTRYNELNEQVKDLERAEQETNQIITKLSKQMKIKFDEEFKKINENFGQVFSELFGGGRAELVLTESETDDPLEQGVDIIAEPPGQKLKNITLLSGGEQALTAIAILFAILKLRSMPFVVLDEVEAALDEMNVVRFAKYLTRFSKNIQFIVVTHRKPTMEKADRLCGVTKQNTVSIIVNIQLSDAIQIAEKDQQK